VAGTGKLTMTRQRKAILDELASTDSHPTADELYDRLRVNLPRISLSSVYRNLEALSRAGMVRTLKVAGSQKRFDADTREHYHVRCSSCGRVADLPFEPMLQLDKEAARLSGFDVTGHRLKFIGVCPQCKAGQAHPGHEEADEDA